MASRWYHFRIVQPDGSVRDRRIRRGLKGDALDRQWKRLRAELGDHAALQVLGRARGDVKAMEADDPEATPEESRIQDLELALRVANLMLADSWLRVSEVAELLGITEGRVCHLADDGTLQDNGVQGRDRRINPRTALAYQKRQSTAIDNGHKKDL